MLHTSLNTSYEQWLVMRSKMVLQYVHAYSARMAATPGQREAFEKAIRLSPASRNPGRFFPPVHLPLLVYAGVHGVDEPAIPVSGATLLVSIGADLYDNLNDGDLSEEWQVYPEFEIIFTADAIACVLPQSIVAALDIPATCRQRIQELLARCLLQMFAGQAQDLALTHAKHPSIEAVEASVLAKSGLQGALYTGLAAYMTDASEEVAQAYVAFGRNLGMVLQLRSDAHELFYDPECRDLANSTRTLQIALCLERLSGLERSDFLSLLDQAQTDVAVQQQVRAKLRQIRFMHPWMAIVHKYLAEAEAALEIAAPQESARSILHTLLSAETLKKFWIYLESRYRLDLNIMTERGNSLYLDQVRRYYDEVTPLYLKHMGKTYQAGLIATESEDADPYRATNLYFASRAGIQPDQHVLDAGCGIGGPSIDIVQNIERVRVDAITLSPVQAYTAKELIQQAGLSDRIQVHIGDFHYLPFANGTFDIVFFFESVGYSYALHELFAEVYRVLHPGGSIYIKGIFSKEPPLSDQEQQELEEFNRIYAHKTPRMSITTQIISTVGFRHIASYDLTEILSTKEYRQTMVEFKYGFPTLTELGKYHRDTIPEKHTDTPIYRFGEIKAWKPA